MSEYPDKPKEGRPTSYRPEYAEQALDFCLLGATEEEMAEIFDCSTATLRAWRKEHPEFLLAIKEGKAVADAKVAKSLYRQALDGNTVAMIFWLKNRKPTNWRDKREIEQTGDAQAVTVVVRRFEDEVK